MTSVLVENSPTLEIIRTYLKIKVRVSGKAQINEKADHTCSI